VTDERRTCLRPGCNNPTRPGRFRCDPCQARQDALRGRSRQLVLVRRQPIEPADDGAAYEQHLARGLTVACPQCHARPGDGCHGPRGYPTSPHAWRADVAAENADER
jgi:hypothetical protein